MTLTALHNIIQHARGQLETSHLIWVWTCIHSALQQMPASSASLQVHPISITIQPFGFQPYATARLVFSMLLSKAMLRPRARPCRPTHTTA